MFKCSIGIQVEDAAAQGRDGPTEKPAGGSKAWERGVEEKGFQKSECKERFLQNRESICRIQVDNNVAAQERDGPPTEKAAGGEGFQKERFLQKSKQSSRLEEKILSWKWGELLAASWISKGIVYAGEKGKKISDNCINASLCNVHLHFTPLSQWVGRSFQLV